MPTGSPPTCVFVSFRLGGHDGVSVVAEQWMRAVRDLGFEVVTVAGEGPVDRLVPGLGIDAREPPDPDELRASLHADLVIVENLLTIPLNLPASQAVAAVLAGRPALLHHHDPPWQRARFRHVRELPPDDPAWRHVAINRLTAAQLRDRGIDAAVVYNGFDTDPPRGRRERQREHLAVRDDELLLVHPVRAIERKDIPRALALAEALGATYWLTGPPEEGYDDVLRSLLAGATTRVLHRRADRLDDLYAAADAVLFPSRWEGFGNPPVEASIRRRPVAVGGYPVLDELVALGFSWMDVDDHDAVEAFVREPDQEVLDRNAAVAREHFSHDAMAAAVRAVLESAGWLP